MINSKGNTMRWLKSKEWPERVWPKRKPCDHLKLWDEGVKGGSIDGGWWPK